MTKQRERILWTYLTVVAAWMLVTTLYLMKLSDLIRAGCEG